MTKISKYQEVSALEPGDYIPVVRPSGDDWLDRRVAGSNIVGGYEDALLITDAEATETVVTVNRIPTGAGTNDFWAVIDPWTVECEIRKVTPISDTVIAIAALDYAHALGDAVLFVADPTLNVKWFGAKGDGSTNDATAIQACIDATPDESAILFPEGTYYITSSISITGKDHVWICGPGKIKVVGAIPAFDVDDTASRSTEFIIFKDLFIVGDDTSTGIEIDDTNGNGVRDVRVINCEISKCKYAIHTTPDGTINPVWVQDCRLTATDIEGSIGVHIESPDCKVMDNTIRGFETGIQIDSPSPIIRGNHIYMSPSSSHLCDIAIRRGKDAASYGYLIVGNYLDGDPDDGAIVIDSLGARSVSITGNYFRIVHDGGPFIAWEHTAGDAYDIQAVVVTSNIFYGVGDTKTNGITFTNSQTDDSVSFQLRNNAWRSATPYSTSDDVRQVLTYGETVVPNPMLGRLVQITLTGNISIDQPTNVYKGGIGNKLTFLFIQDGDAGRTVSWHAEFKQGWSDADNTADLRSTITFEWDGTNWNQVGAQSPYV